MNPLHHPLGSNKMTSEIWKSFSSEATTFLKDEAINTSLNEPVFHEDFFSDFYILNLHSKLTSEEVKYYRTHIQDLITLEVACGIGRLFVPLLQAGCNVYGIDISESMLDKLKSRLLPSEWHRVIQWNALQIPYPVDDESFERVIIPFSTYAVLYNDHIDKLDDNSVFHEFYRILRPGGLVILNDTRTGILDKSGDIASIALQELQGKDKNLEGCVKGNKLCFTLMRCT